MYTKFCQVPAQKVAICPNVGWLKDFPDPQTLPGSDLQRRQHPARRTTSNWPQLDDPAINEAMNDAKLLIDPAERAQAWAEIDKKVTEQAPTVNWIWDKTPNIRSANVNGVVDADNAMWDFAHTSLEVDHPTLRGPATVAGP